MRGWIARLIHREKENKLQDNIKRNYACAHKWRSPPALEQLGSTCNMKLFDTGDELMQVYIMD